MIKFAATVLLAGLALGFALSSSNRFRKNGEEQAKVWFYDQSSKSLYPAARDTLPPEHNGVRAIVVTFEGEEEDSSKRQIAYLQKYSPELKSILERVKAARATQRPTPERAPPPDSPFFVENTFVRSPEEAQWQAANSVEGQKIMSAWHTWRGPQGQRPVVCLP